MGRKKKEYIDGWGNPLPEIEKKIKKEKVISKKRKEAVILDEKYIENFPIEAPSMSFCNSCKNSDLRVIKDRMNEAIILIKIIAEELGIEGEGYKDIKKELINWIRKERNRKENLLKKVKGNKK